MPGTAYTISLYFYNLERFFFAMDFQVCYTKAWKDLLGCNLEHVEFTDKVNESLQLYFLIRQGMENSGIMTKFMCCT